MKIPRILLNILLIVGLANLLVACGNKGPLVHPDKAKPAQEASAPGN